MDAIVNVTPQWGIGYEGQLLISISADLRRFRTLTENRVVIYGRKTLETFPGRKPLKNRRNLILSRNPALKIEGAEIFHSLEELFEELRRLPGESLCVVGGDSVYRQLLPYCGRAFVTKTYFDLPADCFFPDLDSLPNWEAAAALPVLKSDGIEYQFIDYVNHSPKSFCEFGEPSK